MSSMAAPEYRKGIPDKERNDHLEHKQVIHVAHMRRDGASSCIPKRDSSLLIATVIQLHVYLQEDKEEEEDDDEDLSPLQLKNRPNSPAFRPSFGIPTFS
ncbi:uncharacterized protein VTP21DRAFT_8182 [Calcarisporiella thermophila]|uniref:uncharacterized protein n=1 Tax=Calcarisporiella thermophila TaxID=911321 RepID=UPI003743D541